MLVAVACTRNVLPRSESPMRYVDPVAPGTSAHASDGELVMTAVDEPEALTATKARADDGPPQVTEFQELAAAVRGVHVMPSGLVTT